MFEACSTASFRRLWPALNGLASCAHRARRRPGHPSIGPAHHKRSACIAACVMQPAIDEPFAPVYHGLYRIATLIARPQRAIRDELRARSGKSSVAAEPMDYLQPALVMSVTGYQPVPPQTARASNSHRHFLSHLQLGWVRQIAGPTAPSIQTELNQLAKSLQTYGRAFAASRKRQQQLTGR